MVLQCRGYRFGVVAHAFYRESCFKQDRSDYDVEDLAVDAERYLKPKEQYKHWKRDNKHNDEG